MNTTNNKWTFSKADSVNTQKTYSINLNLEKDLFTKFDLAIYYGKDKKGVNNIPISAQSSLSGFVAGLNWKPVSIQVNQTADAHQFKYSVIGIIEWNLFGLAIYNQAKEYKGFAAVP